jgi:hypothetical protein
LGASTQNKLFPYESCGKFSDYPNNFSFSLIFIDISQEKINESENDITIFLKPDFKDKCPKCQQAAHIRKDGKKEGRLSVCIETFILS